MAILLVVGTDLLGQGRGAAPQGRGRGAGPGGRAGGPAARGPRAGTVERITVHGKALEGNLEGDAPERNVTVYLPPSYGADKERRYPVVYLLHGYSGRDDTFTAQLAKLAESADRMAAAQGFSEPIVVTPDAYTLHKGSMYSASPTTGDWERFIAEDLVSHIDGRYRTYAGRMSRGLAGHSMGGYGALRIAMKRPDVFSSLYVMSACCLTTEGLDAKTLATAEAITTREQAVEAANAPGLTGPSIWLALSAAWSPNPRKPPLFLDLPVERGTLRPDIMAAWTANTPLAMLEHYAENLNRLYAIGIDVGTKDPLLAQNRQLHEAMTRLRIPHGYEEYDGDHTNRVGERIERYLLPFFSKNLASPANPSSPPMDR